MKTGAAATKKAVTLVTTITKPVDQIAKTFTLADLIKHTHFEKKTIIEICAQYPSKGILPSFSASLTHAFINRSWI